MKMSLYHGPVGVQTNDNRDYARPVITIYTSILTGDLLREDAVILAELLRVALSAEKRVEQALSEGAS